MYSPKVCILFSTADWDSPYWTNKQHTADLFAKSDCEVLYVESIGLRKPSAKSGRDWVRLSKRLWKGIKSLIFGPENVQKNLWVLSPLAIPVKQQSSLVQLINNFILRLGVLRFLKFRDQSSVLVWTYHPFMINVTNGINYNFLVYHCVDDLSAVPGIDAQTFKTNELVLLGQADAVFATAPSLFEYCSRFNKNTHYFSNVVDFSHFSSALFVVKCPEDIANIGWPRIIYHGVLSDYKIDFDLLLNCIRMKPEWSWVFIGEPREGQANEKLSEIKNLSNAHFLGYKPYKDLPLYLGASQVGILPSQINKYTKSMFPMKYYEYIAAGLPVASTGLDSFAGWPSDKIHVGNDPNGFLNAIENCLLIGRIKNIDVINQIVGDHTWEGRHKKMMGVLSMSDNMSQIAS